MHVPTQRDCSDCLFGYTLASLCVRCIDRGCVPVDYRSPVKDERHNMVLVALYLVPSLSYRSMMTKYVAWPAGYNCMCIYSRPGYLGYMFIHCSDKALKPCGRLTTHKTSH